MNLFNFNFKYGEELAREQDNLIECYKNNIPVDINATLRDLENNEWVVLAKRLAPSNLVIRQYCLIDIFKNSPDHVDEIIDQLFKLTYCKEKIFNVFLLYAEGYSYWLYVKYILKIWADKFVINRIKNVINAIDNSFLCTSYLRNGIRYPAPFGDLRDIPLEDCLQTQPKITNIHISNIFMITNREFDKIISYQCIVNGIPVGLNTHIPKSDYTVYIKNGVPIGFKFYTGYANKYKNKFAEILDTFDPKRIVTIV